MSYLDIKLALRALRRAPSTAITAVITLAVGIGSATAAFTAFEQLLLRPLPFSQPDRLVRIWESQASGAQDRFAAPGNAATWRERARGLADVTLFLEDPDRMVLSTPAGNVQVRQTSVSPNFLAVMGVQPLLGRAFSAGGTTAAAADSASEVLISETLWSSAFGRDANVVGRTLRIEGRSSYVVVGVLATRTTYPLGTDVWFSLGERFAGEEARDARLFGVVGRTRPGVTIDSLRAELASIADRLASEHPSSNAGWSAAVQPLRDSVNGAIRPLVVTAAVAVAFVLIVACANVSTLLITRAAARRREVAVHVALGANHRQIIGRHLLESLILAIAGAASGWLLARLALGTLWRFLPPAMATLQQPQLNWRALAFCVVVTTLVTLLLGGVPALLLSRAQVGETMRAEGERSIGSRRNARLLHGLLGVQVAMALVVVVTAVLLERTFISLQRVDLGFNRTNVVSVDVRMPLFAIQTRDRWYRIGEESGRLTERLTQLPGTTSVAVASESPMAGHAVTTPVRIAGAAADEGPAHPPITPVAIYHRVSPTYFHTLEIPVLAGRGFTEADASTVEQLTNPRAAPREGTVIVNETLARALWPKGEAIGRLLSTGFDRRTTSGRRVVGIVRDSRSQSARAAPAAEVYVPFREDPSFAFTVLVRSSEPVRTLAPTLRKTITGVNPDLSSANIRTLDEVFTESLGSSPVAVVSLGAFAVTTILLAAVAAYAILAFTLGGKTREIAVRLALGAGQKEVARCVLQEVLVASGLGLIAGIAMGLGLTRLFTGLLFGVGPSDPWTFVCAVGVMLVVIAAAVYPALRRARRTNPSLLLRS